MVKGLKRMACLLLVLMLLAGSAWAEGWVCQGCSRQNDERYNFCPDCGAKRQAVACPECGYELSADEQEFKFCPICQTQLTEDAPAEEVTVEDTKNTARVTIDGEEHIFYLSYSNCDDSMLTAHYVAFNPRGEHQYYLQIRMPAEAKAGDKYMSYEDNLYDESDDVYAILYTKYHDAALYNQWSGEYHMGYIGKGELILEVLSRSDDWMTYSLKGAARAEYKPYRAGRDDLMITMEFNFTVGEEHPYAEEMDRKAGPGPDHDEELDDLLDSIGGGGSNIVPDSTVVTFTDTSNDDCYSCGGTGSCKACDGFGYTYTMNFGNGSYKRDCGLCVDGACRYCQ